jgi:hypothetical protein
VNRSIANLRESRGALADSWRHGSCRARSGWTSSCHGPKIEDPTHDVAGSADPAAARMAAVRLRAKFAPGSRVMS